jgi:predicted DNA-binding antitoxin AbrB/MazE fold protein
MEGFPVVWFGLSNTTAGRYNQTVSIKVAYRDGVFEPLEKVEGAEPGAIHTAFSEEELRDFLETLEWLKTADKSFEFWNNPDDAVYDRL